MTVIRRPAVARNGAVSGGHFHGGNASETFTPNGRCRQTRLFLRFFALVGEKKEEMKAGGCRLSVNKRGF